MKLRDADPADALPNWWLACAALACLACVVLFAIALTYDSVALGFGAILVLLLAATGLPWLLHRHRQRKLSDPS